MPTLTVLTPTYNRSNLLSKLCDSLLQQDCTDFEWLIIDDGSTDNTEEIINKKLEIRNSKFKVTYYKKENGGKHTAINLGVKLADGDLIFIADSDDTLPSNAIKTVIKYWESIKDDKSFAGVCGLDADTQGRIIGSGLPSEIIDDNTINIRFKLGISGDMKEVFRTDVLREFPFPEIEGEKFCPEMLVWNRISTKYKLRYFNKVIYTADYQSTGISANIIKARMNSPIASMMTYQEMTEYDVPLIVKVKSAINYWRFRFCYHKRMDSNVSVPVLRKVWNVFYPIAFLMHLRDVIMVRQ